MSSGGNVLAVSLMLGQTKGSDLDAVAVSMDARTATASNACPKTRLAGRRSRARNCRLASR